MATQDENSACPACGATSVFTAHGSLASNPLYAQAKRAVIRSYRWHHRLKVLAFLGLGTGMWLADVMDDVMRFLCKTTDSMLNVMFNWTVGWIWGRAADRFTIIYSWYNVIAFVIATYLVYRAAKWYFWTCTVEDLEQGKSSQFEVLTLKLAGGWILQYFLVAVLGNLLLGGLWPADLPKYPSFLTTATLGVGAGTLYSMSLMNSDSART